MVQWTTIPPWLYQNTLPDDQLQEVYVREAKKQWEELRRRRTDLEAELLEVTEAEQRARLFLADAIEAMQRYRPARATVTEARRALPRPRRR